MKEGWATTISQLYRKKNLNPRPSPDQVPSSSNRTRKTMVDRSNPSPSPPAQVITSSNPAEETMGDRNNTRPSPLSRVLYSSNPTEGTMGDQTNDQETSFNTTHPEIKTIDGNQNPKKTCKCCNCRSSNAKNQFLDDESRGQGKSEIILFDLEDDAPENRATGTSYIEHVTGCKETTNSKRVKSAKRNAFVEQPVFYLDPD